MTNHRDVRNAMQRATDAVEQLSLDIDRYYPGAGIYADVARREMAYVAAQAAKSALLVAYKVWEHYAPGEVSSAPQGREAGK